MSDSKVTKLAEWLKTKWNQLTGARASEPEAAPAVDALLDWTERELDLLAIAMESEEAWQAYQQRQEILADQRREYEDSLLDTEERAA